MMMIMMLQKRVERDIQEDRSDRYMQKVRSDSDT